MLDRRPVVRTLDDLWRGTDMALRIQDVNAILLHLAHPQRCAIGSIANGSGLCLSESRHISPGKSRLRIYAGGLSPG
jgi:hypothetical protein